MLNEARLELEECIAELDARGRNNEEANDVDTEKEVVEGTASTSST